MNTREDIFTALRQIMVEMFDMDAENITLEARLYQDLDFDSIDAIDLIVRLNQITGKMVQPEDFKTARSVDDVVEAIYRLIHH